MDDYPQECQFVWTTSGMSNNSSWGLIVFSSHWIAVVISVVISHGHISGHFSGQFIWSILQMLDPHVWGVSLGVYNYKQMQYLFYFDPTVI